MKITFASLSSPCHDHKHAIFGTRSLDDPAEKEH